MSTFSKINNTYKSKDYGIDSKYIFDEEPKFNKEILNDYFNNADYYGAVNYLKRITPKDVQSRVELNKRIRELRRMAEYQEGFVNNIRSEYGDDARDAYVFLHRLRNGASMDVNDSNMDFDIKDNKFVKDYSEINYLHITDLNSGEIYIPDKIQIQLDGAGTDLLKKEFLDRFKNELAQGKTFEQLGITETNNGVNVDIYSPYLDTVIKALNDVNTNLEDRDIREHKQHESSKAVKDALFDIVLPVLEKMTGKDLYSYNYEPEVITKDYYKLYLYNTQKNIKENITNQAQHKALLSASNALGSAKSLEKQYNEQFSKKNVIEETYVSQFLGAGHIQAYNMLKSGKIDIDDYNKIVKERQDTYDRLIQQTDLTQYKVYATDIESNNELENAFIDKVGSDIVASYMDTKKRDETSMHELDNYDRRDLTKDLLVAIKDKRVTYSAAMVGGEMGTYITITPDIDEETGRPKEGSSAKYRRIFIPHLFESSCEEALNADTRSMAVRDLSDIGRYNYAKTLSDGSSLEYDKNGNLTLYTPYATSEEDNSRQRIISKDEALLLLDRDNAIDQSVDAILAQLGDSYTKKDVDTLAQYAAEAIVNNLYKNINRGDRELEISRVYTSILKGLKIK